MASILSVPVEMSVMGADLGPDLGLLDKRIVINTKWFNTELGDEFKKSKIGMFSEGLGNADFKIVWDNTRVVFITQTELLDCFLYRYKLKSLMKDYGALSLKIFVDKSIRTSYYNAFEEFVTKDLRHLFTPVANPMALPVLLKEMADEEGKPINPYVMKMVPQAFKKTRKDREGRNPRTRRTYVKNKYHNENIDFSLPALQ